MTSYSLSSLAWIMAAFFSQRLQRGLRAIEEKTNKAASLKSSLCYLHYYLLYSLLRRLSSSTTVTRVFVSL